MFGTVGMSLDEKCALLPGVSGKRILHEMPWLIRPLVDTEYARARLQAWVDDGGLDRPSPVLADFRKRVAYWGDEQVLNAVLMAFVQMAPPARDYVAARAFFIGTGWSTHGWTCGAASFVTTERQEVIVLSGASRNEAAVRRTALHEAAHCWLEPKESQRESSTCGWTEPADAADVAASQAVDADIEERRCKPWELRAEMLVVNWNQRPRR